METTRKAVRLGMSALATAALLLSATAGAATPEEMKVAEKWLDECSQSTLSREQQLKELEWFIDAAKPFRGMNITVVSEKLTTHEYESKVLAKAFSELTGINVTHDLIQEGDVIEKLQTEMQSKRSIYDAYVND